MKIRPAYFIIILLYLLIFVYAFAQLRKEILPNSLWYSIGKFALYLMLILCSTYFVVVNSHFKISKWMTLLFVLVGYELFITFFHKGGFSLGEVLRDIIVWPIISVVFCDFFRKKSSLRVLNTISVICMPVLFIYSIPNLIVHINGHGKAGSVIFPVYFLFTIIPLLYLVCERKVIIIYSIISAIIITMSTKRLGFMIMASSTVLVFLARSYMQGKLKHNMSKLIKSVIWVFIAMVTVYVLMRRYNTSMWTRIASLRNDEGSGRIEIWQIVIDSFRKSSLLYKLFGHGFHAVKYNVNVYGRSLYAHNSFLEMLYDYGYIGLCMCIMIVYRICKRGIRLIKERNYEALALIYTIPITIGAGLFSYFFEQSYIIVPVSVAWGVCMSSDMRDFL